MPSKNTTEETAQIWKEIQDLFQQAVKDEKPVRVRVVEEIFQAAVGLAQESPGTLNLKIAATALKELRFSFKIFYPHRFTPKITMFGSARVPADTPLYNQAKSFASLAVKENFMIMTGGGPGIMAAGNEGAKQKSGFGLNILLPMEQDPNPFVDSENNLLNYKYFFTRKLFLVKEACAFAFFPGGFGTFDEAFEVLTLLQTGKTNIIPIVLLEPKGFGYWEKFYEFMEQGLMKKKFIAEEDLKLFRVCHDPAEALAHIQEFYSNYHSMRYVKDKLVIRLKRKLSEKSMDEIRKKFASLSKDGEFEQCGPLPQERNEPELDKLSRLVFPFLKMDFGGLRSLIDFTNGKTI